MRSQFFFIKHEWEIPGIQCFLLKIIHTWRLRSYTIALEYLYDSLSLNPLLFSQEWSRFSCGKKWHSRKPCTNQGLCFHMSWINWTSGVVSVYLKDLTLCNKLRLVRQNCRIFFGSYLSIPFSRAGKPTLSN